MNVDAINQRALSLAKKALDRGLPGVAADGCHAAGSVADAADSFVELAHAADE